MTCGYFAEVTNQCLDNSLANNGRLAHGTLIGAMLNAESHLVCSPGKGIIKGAELTPPMDAIHYLDYALNDTNIDLWDHTQYIPDGIIIALGNNDRVENSDAFTEAYIRLLEKIVTTYPSTEIILTEGPMINGGRKEVLTSNLKTIEAKFNNAKLHIIPSKYYPQTTNCDGHPTAATHAEIAHELAPQIKDIMHW